MSVGGEFSGVALSFVARPVTEGAEHVKTVQTVFDDGEKKNVQTEVAVEDPVVIFFPNRTCQVLPMKAAHKKGFLNMPAIMNFDQVTDGTTPAGIFKFGLRESDKLQAWQVMEDTLIAACISKSGHPLPRFADYSPVSIHVGE